MAYGQRSITSLIFKWQNGNGHGNILQSWAVLTNLSRVAFRQVRQRLADWVREIGVDDEHLSPNHAWRHTFKLIGSRAAISDSLLDYISDVSRGFYRDARHSCRSTIC